MTRTRLASGFFALALAAFTLAQCGSDSLCDRAKKLDENAAPCSMPGMTMTTRCDESKCSSADKEKVSAFLDCAEGAGACVKGKELEWFGKVAACVPKLEGVTQACAGQ